MNLRSVQDVLELALSLAKKRGAAGAECVFVRSESRSCTVCDDDVKRRTKELSSRLGLRILDGKRRQGVAALNDMDDDAALRLCDMAFANAACGAPEEDVLFADVSPEQPPFDLGLYDAELVDWAPEKQIERCFDMSRRARALDRRVKKVRSSSAGSAWRESLALNSNGVSFYRRASAGGLGLELIAQEGDAVEIGGASAEGRSLASLTACLPTEEAVEHTVRLLHGHRLPSGRFTLVLEPEVSASFVAQLSELFSAESLCRKLTLLAGKMGQKVASEALTLVDDGRLYGGLGSAVCDCEFVPTGRTAVLERGRLNAWLCNLQYGKRLGLPSTGNGYRGVASLPGVDVNNFYVMPGLRSFEEITAAHDGCFCVTELMGLHTVDAVTGDFSLAARGLLYKNGTFQPVSSVTIAGNLLDFLQKITEVGGDLRFFGCFGGCTMVVEDIAVAGE